jgi:hypothetical protein
VWFAASISSTWFIRSNDTTSPPAAGTAAPDSPVPEPRAVTRSPWAPATFSTPATSAVLPGLTTNAGAVAATVRLSSWP